MAHQTKINLLDLSKQIRINVLKMVHHAKASHVGSCFSIADILAVLYGSYLKLCPKNPEWPERDRFILSKGHAGAAVYAVLALRGFIRIDELALYGDDNSRLMAHISHKVPGVEFSTGSLGHGLPYGVGKAFYSKKFRAGWKVCVLLSDGEFDEGSNWEALMFASHHKLDNLLVIIDYNKLQSLGSVDETLALEPLAEKLRSFGSYVLEVDGHDHSKLELTFNSIPDRIGMPTIIIAHTIKGKGVSFMENKVEWHYKSPSIEQMREALAELGNK